MNKRKVVKYLDSLYNNGGYAFSQYSNRTILSTDFSVSLQHILKENHALKRYEDIKKYLQESRQENGLVIDKTFDLNNQGHHKNDYVTYQFTFFTLIALDILGVKYDQLDFMSPFLNKESLLAWFAGLEWGRFWYESNKIMFIMYFLSYLHLYGDNDLKTRAADALEICFDVLNKRQDPETGFWGTDLNGNNLYDGCYGAAHIFLFYDYFKREIRYPEKIIDSTLKLHSRNGLMGSEEGGACEDYDAIDIYYRILKQKTYRRNEIEDKLLLIKEKISRAQNRDGGFSYRVSNFKPQFLRKQPKLDLSITYKYSSWERMETPVYASDTWATFFKVLTLEVIEQMTSKKPMSVNAYHLPGWGFIK